MVNVTFFEMAINSGANIKAKPTNKIPPIITLPASVPSMYSGSI